MSNSQQLRYPEAPRFHQRGEGPRTASSESYTITETPHARSLARLKHAMFRNEAFNGVAR